MGTESGLTPWICEAKEGEREEVLRLRLEAGGKGTFVNPWFRFRSFPRKEQLQSQADQDLTKRHFEIEGCYEPRQRGSFINKHYAKLGEKASPPGTESINLSEMKKAAVILSGCGVYDGAEIHESVLALLALDEAGVSYQCLAPDIPQAHVIDHTTGQATGETRQVLKEAARIARGEIAALRDADASSFDLVIMPGGFGAAKNLSNFAFDAANLTIEASLERFLKAANAQGKPIGIACIAPAIAARIFGEKGVRFTIGKDSGTAQALEKWGGKHHDKAVDEIVIDETLKIVCTPAYMYETRISEVNKGIRKMVQATIGLA